MEPGTTERNITFFRFEDLRVYHKALDYVSWVHQNTEGIDSIKNNDILVKFNESARSIAINIAEGSARNKSQFVYYLKMAKSSVRDCLVYTSILKNQDLLDDVQDLESRNFLMELTKMVGALISSLQKAQGGGRDHEHDEIEPIGRKHDDTPAY